VSSLNPGREFGDRVYGQLSNALRAQRPDELAGVLDMLARSESYARTVGTVGDVAAQRIAPAVGGVAPSLVEDRGINPPPAMSIGNAEAETDEAEAAAQAAVDAPLASEEVAPEADNSEPEVSIIMIDGREAIYDPTAGAHIFTDTNEFVDAAPMKRGGAVKGYQKGGPAKKTSWYDDMVMAASRRGNDLVAAAADLADRYGVTPANAAAWIAKNVEGRSPQEVARIRQNLQPLGSNRAVVEAGVRSNERRFRQAGGTGARKDEDVQMPVRMGAVTYKPASIPAAVVREAPNALRAVNQYFQNNTPTGVMQDVGNAARSGYEAVKADPYGSVFNTLMYGSPQTILAATPFDYAQMRESSQMLDPYVKDDAEAARMQSIVDAASVLPTLAVVPGAGMLARKGTRKKRR
jgi:hypothetical protein